MATRKREMIVFNVREIDLHRLNSLTKYPSIPTYHKLDPANGSLVEEAIQFDGSVVGTEKIDGTNARIISLPDGSYLIGSREELLYARGDLIGNPALGIVAALREFAESLPPTGRDEITVRFLEVYGGKVTGASKQYTGSRAVGFRLFDLVVIADHHERMAMEPSALSAWRESGGQSYLPEKELLATATADGIAAVPRLFTIDAGELPSGLADMSEFLTERLPRTRSQLDDGGAGEAEGIVLRDATRSVIAKARFQDYRRTLRRQK